LSYKSQNIINQQHGPETEEILDLVDHNDQVIETLERPKTRAAGLRNFRGINAFVINDRGQLWIPRRTAHKKNCPLHLDFSISGHVSSGETYDQTFEREVQEELNLSVHDVHYQKQGKLTPHEHQSYAFISIYLISYNQVPEYNKNDFCEYFWLYPHEILERVA
jgi:isopentenyl-diphosphate delta-isomerase